MKKIWLVAIFMLFVMLGFLCVCVLDNKIDILQAQVNNIPTTTPQFTEYEEPAFTIKTTTKIENTPCWEFCNEFYSDNDVNCTVYCSDAKELTTELKLSDVVLLLLDYENLKYSPEEKTEQIKQAKFIKSL